MPDRDQPSRTDPRVTTSRRPLRRLDLLALFAALSVASLGVGGWLTSMGFGPWYDDLAKPSFQPPGWVFGPAWTSIFALLTIACWQVARRGRFTGSIAWLYGVQYALNLLWSLLFFTLHDPALALVDIVVLDVVVLAMVRTYGRVHAPSGWCLVPYAAWLGLATTLNAWIVLNN